MTSPCGAGQSDTQDVTTVHELTGPARAGDAA